MRATPVNVPASRVRGNVTVWRPTDGAREVLIQKQNQIQISWGAIATQCIGNGNPAFRINAMYLEYENVADPEDTISPPTFERGDSLDYYQDLTYSGSRDFLRVPLLLRPTIGIETDFEDFFTDGVDGNKLTFHAQSQGTAGFHGKPFNSGVNSKVFGVALVATPVFADPSRDVIFSRTYFEVADQTAKLAGPQQIGVTWDIVFE